MTSLPIRGIIEGFYGPLWSWDDRHRAVAFLGEHGGNTYVYAPKNDPWHRDRWREPYLPEDWERFSRLAQEGQRVGVDLWFGISPLGLRASDEDDVDHLLAKVAAADASGLRRICLLFDDMPDAFADDDDGHRFATLAAAHAHVVETVRRFLADRGSDRRLWLVPLHYHGDPDQPYVRELGERVHPDVAILWTGPEVCSETITASHLEAAAASLQRPVLIWDNHPVNDGGMWPDPHLGPLRGREAPSAGSATGFLSNVAIEPEASLIAVATFLEHADDPGAYDAEQAWWRALGEVTGDADDTQAVAVLAELSPRSPLQRSDPLVNWLADPMHRLDEAWESGGDAARRHALDEVRHVVGGLAAAAARLDGGLRNRRLGADLAPWSRKLRHQVTAAQLAIDVLRDTLTDAPASDGRERTAAVRREVLAHLDAGRATLHWVAGDQLEVLARRCLLRAAPPPDLPRTGEVRR